MTGKINLPKCRSLYQCTLLKCCVGLLLFYGVLDCCIYENLFIPSVELELIFFYVKVMVCFSKTFQAFSFYKGPVKIGFFFNSALFFISR